MQQVMVAREDSTGEHETSHDVVIMFPIGELTFFKIKNSKINF